MRGGGGGVNVAFSILTASGTGPPTNKIRGLQVTVNDAIRMSKIKSAQELVEKMLEVRVAEGLRRLDNLVPVRGGGRREAEVSAETDRHVGILCPECVVRSQHAQIRVVEF